MTDMSFSMSIYLFSKCTGEVGWKSALVTQEHDVYIKISLSNRFYFSQTWTIEPDINFIRPIHWLMIYLEFRPTDTSFDLDNIG